MKRIIHTFVILLFVFLQTSKAQDYAVFKEGLIGHITPRGWLREFLERQKTGMTGHPEALSYPYNTCLWAGDIPRNTDSYGQDWWRYEQTAYYTDGLLRLGYLLKDDELIKKGEEGIAYTLSHAQSTGRLGNPVISSLWPMAVFFRAMKANYEYDGNANIPTALRKNYISLTQADLTNGRRHILNLEGLLWTYGETGLRTLLMKAENAYKAGGFEMDMTQAGSDDYIHMHGVTYCEMLKIPMLLYAYTGKQNYLQLALNCEHKLERDHMLPDGVPSSAEYTLGRDIDVAHETCDITDYTWSLGYFLSATGDAKWADCIEKAIFNAGLGAVTKDFRSLQYFSSVNQMICTGKSDNNDFKRGSTWMAYRPTHETECCAGNVNRMMPNFASRLWMTDKEGGMVAAMFAPSEVDFQKDSIACRIVEDTYYPFDGEINFRFSMEAPAEMPFSFRIPGWCKNYTLWLNGQQFGNEALAGTFVTLRRKFQDGDVVTLRMEMQPRVVEAADEQGRYVECGPLLFSYPVPTLREVDTKVYSNMNGKVSENPEFVCWSMKPAGPFNYAINTADTELQLNIDREKLQSGYPFDAQTTPLSVTLPVRRIKWPLTDGRYNPTLPASKYVTATDTVESVQLVPYGSTELRLTVFPVTADKAAMTLTDSLLTNPDFELYDAKTYNQGGTERKTYLPYGWKVRGTINGTSYGINKDATNLHGENVCWFRLLPLSTNFQLYQTIAANKLTPGTYRVSCLLWNQSNAKGNCRLFANNNVQYFGKESEYVKNQVATEQATFAGHSGSSGSPFTLSPMEVYVTVAEGENLTVGIRSTNMKSDGTLATGSDATGWFKVDHFRIERVAGPTAIEHTTQNDAVASGCYDLAGRKIQENALGTISHKGIFISNGRKVAVR